MTCEMNQRAMPNDVSVFIDVRSKDDSIEGGRNSMSESTLLFKRGRGMLTDKPFGNSEFAFVEKLRRAEVKAFIEDE